MTGKASVSHITVPLGFVVVPKALAMAHLSAAASLFVILPLSSSRFCPLAPYCYHPLPGWHPTAYHPLAPYCQSPAGTLLLFIGWHPTANRRWLASPLPGGSARHLHFRSVGPSSVTPSRGIALPPWLLSNALDQWNDLPDRTTWFRWALYWSFPMSPITYPPPSGQRFWSSNR